MNDTLVETSAMETDYKKALDRNQRLINAVQAKLADSEQENTDIYKVRLRQLQRERMLIRPANQKDIEYRHTLRQVFAQAIRSLDPQKTLRFHATRFVNVADIIDSHSISSAVDHDGIRKSNDVSGFFSVTTSENIQISLNDYLDIKDSSIPAGCIFVLFPKNEAEATDKSSMSMSNVTLIDQSGQVSPQLFRILCTPETLPTIKEYLQRNQMDPGYATTYMDFVQDSMCISPQRQTTTTSPR